MTFDLYSCQFHFAARDTIHFPPGKPGNLLRGAFGSAFREAVCVPECPGFSGADVRKCELRGSCAYARVFEPAASGLGPSGLAPSGLADSPRPFVFRAAHLDGRTIVAGEQFCFGMNLFDMRRLPVDEFARAFQQLRQMELLSFEPAEVSIPLEPRPIRTNRIVVEFRTPTELKSGDGLVEKPEFGVLFARARDRVSTLRALYGAGPPSIDFRALGERAATVRMLRSDLRHVEAARRSSRTGQVHGIGGFVGMAEYEGDLAEFLPYLEAAHWTGVGRHCVWGNGEIRLQPVGDW